MDAKDIKKLADACRKAGIKHFKNADIEFTLNDVIPSPIRRKSRKTESSSQNVAQTEVESDFSGLSEEDILFWSSPRVEENQ